MKKRNEEILLNQISKGITLYKRDTSRKGKVLAINLAKTAVMNLKFITKRRNVADIIRPFLKMGSVSIGGYTIYNDRYNYNQSKQEEYSPIKD